MTTRSRKGPRKTKGTMTAKDKQIREAMDLLQEMQFNLSALEVTFTMMEMPMSSKLAKANHEKIRRFQKRWSKSQRQPQ